MNLKRASLDPTYIKYAKSGVKDEEKKNVFTSSYKNTFVPRRADSAYPSYGGSIINKKQRFCTHYKMKYLEALFFQSLKIGAISCFFVALLYNIYSQYYVVDVLFSLMTIIVATSRKYWEKGLLTESVYGEGLYYEKAAIIIIESAPYRLLFFYFYAQFIRPACGIRSDLYTAITSVNWYFPVTWVVVGVCLFYCIRIFNTFVPIKHHNFPYRSEYYAKSSRDEEDCDTAIQIKPTYSQLRLTEKELKELIRKNKEEIKSKQNSDLVNSAEAIASYKAKQNKIIDKFYALPFEEQKRKVKIARDIYFKQSGKKGFIPKEYADPDDNLPPKENDKCFYISHDNDKVELLNRGTKNSFLIANTIMASEYSDRIKPETVPLPYFDSNHIYRSGKFVDLYGYCRIKNPNKESKEEQNKKNTVQQHQVPAKVIVQQKAAQSQTDKTKEIAAKPSIVKNTISSDDLFSNVN